MMKKLLAVLLPVAFVATSAHAATSIVSDSFDGMHDAIESGTEVLTSAGSFSAMFEFSLASTSEVSFTGFTTLPVFALGLFDSADALVAGGLFSPTTFGTSFTTTTLSAGDYYYAPVFALSGSAGDMYTFESTVSAVPEPETYAMMLAGLGMLGFVARRRMERM